MSISVLFNPRTPQAGRIGSLQLDATISENHVATAQITNEPVEQGSNISDHIVNDPEEITIEGFITNTPVTGGFGNNTQAAFDTLFQLREARQLITVVTAYRVYSDMAIRRIAIPRDRFTGQSLRFTVDLVKVIKAGSTSLSFFGENLSPFGGIRDQLSTPVNLGRIVPQVASASIAQRATSVARRVLGI